MISLPRWKEKKNTHKQHHNDYCIEASAYDKDSSLHRKNITWDHLDITIDRISPYSCLKMLLVHHYCHNYSFDFNNLQPDLLLKINLHYCWVVIWEEPVNALYSIMCRESNAELASALQVHVINPLKKHWTASPVEKTGSALALIAILFSLSSVTLS